MQAYENGAHVTQIFTQTMTGNIIGIISLVIGIASLVLTIITFRTAKKIETEIHSKAATAIDKGRFLSSKGAYIKKLENLRSAAQGNQGISSNALSTIISILNDLKGYYSFIQEEDINSLEHNLQEIQRARREKMVNPDGDFYDVFDRAVANIINILSKGDNQL